MSPVSPLVSGDPRQLGRYILRGRLGFGGMGVVYLAQDAERDELVAIKRIQSKFASHPTYLKRFRREAELARRVAGPFVAKVFDVGIDNDQPFIVTEYIQGPTLEEYVQEHGPISPSQAGLLAANLASALAAIHMAGVIHRDLKPSNVILSSLGPRVIDFGIARGVDDDSRLTVSGAPLGTYAFMAPEQFENARVSRAADVFAWGGLVVYAVTGRPPFGGAHARDEAAIEALRRRVCYARPDLTRLSLPVRELVASAMAKDPSDRPTAAQLWQRSLHDRPAAATDSLILPKAHAKPDAPIRTPSSERRHASPLVGFSSAAGTVRELLVNPNAWLVVILAIFAAVAGALVWWALRGIIAQPVVFLVLGLESVLAILSVIVGGVLAREVELRIATGCFIFSGLLTLMMISGYHGLHNRYWVAFDHEHVSLLKGAGPNGYSAFHLHNTSDVERFSAVRRALPPLIVGLVDHGVEVTDRAEGRRVARCLPLLLAPAPNAPVGPGDNEESCATTLFKEAPQVTVEQQTAFPDATEYSPALLATGKRVVLAWTNQSDGQVYLRSSLDGRNFSRPRALGATSDGEPALAGDGDRIWAAWTEPDGRVAITSSENGGESFGSIMRLDQGSRTAPALAYGDGKLMIAWVDQGSGNLHVTRSPDGIHFEGDQRLDETSDVAPSLMFAGSTWYLSWIGRAGSVVNMLSTTDGVSFDGKRVLEATSNGRPAMTAGDIWLLAWTWPGEDAIGLLISKSRSADFVNELALAEQSGSGLSLTTFQNHLLLAWRDSGTRPSIHVATLA